MVISVTILNGEFAGQAREMPETIDALEMLGGFAKAGIRWEVDFENAEQSELMEWSRADLAGRILAAVFDNRWVNFQGRDWNAEDKTEDEIKDIILEINDAMSDSGMMVFIEIDDETGVWIGTSGTEHPIQ
jgi:hypothetical protein